MLRDSFQEYIDELPEGSQPIDIDKWCEDQKSPMLRFYLLLLNLKLLVLQFVRSVRTGNRYIYRKHYEHYLLLLRVKPFQLCTLDTSSHS